MQFVPLTKIELLDEGQFVPRIQEALDDAQDSLMRHIERFDKEAIGATAEVTIKVIMKCESPNEKMCSLKTTVASKSPAFPDQVSTAIGGTTENDKRRLFVKPSGSAEGSVHQAKLCTKAGETIDTETGEVMEKQESGTGE